MRRVIDFLFGLIIIIFMTYLIIDHLNVQQVQPYINDIQSLSWYDYLLYAFMAAMVIIGIVLLIMALRPSSRKNRLVWETDSGNLEVSRQAVESFIRSTVDREPNVVHEKTHLVFRSNGTDKRITGDIDVLWSANHQRTESSLDDLNHKIKSKLTEFTNADCSELKLNVLDQHKDTTRRVI